MRNYIWGIDVTVLVKWRQIKPLNVWLIIINKTHNLNRVRMYYMYKEKCAIRLENAKSEPKSNTHKNENYKTENG